MSYYVKYSLNYQMIYQILGNLNKKKINFFLDIQSICRGLYNKDTILVEIDRFIENKKSSNILIDELKKFLNNLYKKFQNYDPFFVLFYDDGYNQQNKILYNSYKSGRSIKNVMVDDKEIELFRQIKSHYFNEIPKIFNKKDLSKVFYLKDYESDCIPEYCLINNLFDSNENDVLNIILSVDKDLLQTCKYKNALQCITSFNPSKTGNKIVFGIYDDNNAISYFNKKFKSGILTAKHIPIILSIAGDKADNIPGLKGIGPIKACNMVAEYNLPTELDNIKNLKVDKLPSIFKDNMDIIIRNMKLIDFQQQIKRTPKHIFSEGE